MLDPVAVLSIIVTAAVAFAVAFGVRPRQRRWQPRVVQGRLRPLDDVMRADFAKSRLMNKGEYRVFRLAEEEARKRERGDLVFAQAPLGEVLSTGDRQAFAAINSKRVDIMIVAKDGYPSLAIEVQGAGHHQDNAAERDAVKREALRKAGVAFLEIHHTHKDADVRLAIRATLETGRPPPSPVPPLVPGPSVTAR